MNQLWSIYRWASNDHTIVIEIDTIVNNKDETYLMNAR
jgi:hypothetical protein